MNGTPWSIIGQTLNIKKERIKNMIQLIII